MILGRSRRGAAVQMQSAPPASRAPAPHSTEQEIERVRAGFQLTVQGGAIRRFRMIARNETCTRSRRWHAIPGIPIVAIATSDLDVPATPTWVVYTRPHSDTNALWLRAG
jgi:hypothetical protein